ncbi:hypothetical protein NMY22_g19653 [Coprinellus aureogranulatus]|nr:hypothetical protein NMY22_g19653 [Coprinellus aureogranulatus]
MLTLLPLSSTTPLASGFHELLGGTSPTFILDTWKGLLGDDKAPFWADTFNPDADEPSPGPTFCILRVEAIELVRVASRLQVNSSRKAKMLDWCDGVTRAGFADLHTRYVIQPLLPIPGAIIQPVRQVERPPRLSQGGPRGPRPPYPFARRLDHKKFIPVLGPFLFTTLVPDLSFPLCPQSVATSTALRYTHHIARCDYNPRNRLQQRQATPPPNSDHDIPEGPATPHQSPGPFNHPSSPPRTPAPAVQDGEVPVPPTPSQRTPRRNVWSTQGRPGIQVRKHEYLNGQPCDEDGFDLPNGAPPPPEEPDENPFWPFTDAAEMLLADFLYSKVQMSAGDINHLMQLWDTIQRRDMAERLGPEADLEDFDPPFAHSRDLYSTIDSIPHGDVPWQGFKVNYSGEVNADSPSWKKADYEVWYRNPLDVLEGQISNPEFAEHMDWAAKVVKGQDGKRQYVDLMSGDWAWEQSNILAKSDPDLHGAMFAPVVLGSDKTTVSVATGQNEYYPLYASVGNAQNHLRRAHKGAVSLIGFLSIPKTGRDEQDSLEFRRFRRQLLHSSIARILMPLKRWMTKARVTKCGDGYWRRVVYGIGPYIADYPEQCMLACVAQADDLDGDEDDILIHRSHPHTEDIRKAFDGQLKEMWDGYGMIGDVVPFTAHFPRANIHELLSPDILHQLVKGTFKDHLVTWVVEYLESLPDGKQKVAEMDRRIAAAPHFPGLRHFPEGRGFKQWTGNDSKALMKVFLPAIVGLVPDGMCRAISAFLDFCYLVRRSQIDEDVLDKIDDAIERFHRERDAFVEEGIRDHFNLPRQHSLVHYRLLIQLFGAPNGICSSITESKHITAVKDAYRRSSRNQPLGEMLLINQRMDKLAAARDRLEPHIPLEIRDPRDYRRTIHTTRAPSPKPREGDDESQEVEPAVGMVTSEGDVRLSKRSAPNYPRSLPKLSEHLGIPDMADLIRRFLFDQLYPESEIMGMDIALDRCPQIDPNLHRPFGGRRNAA